MWPWLVGLFKPAPVPKVVVEMYRPDVGDALAVVRCGNVRVQYRGCGTVWRRIDDDQRAPTWLEAKLYDAWAAAERP